MLRGRALLAICALVVGCESRPSASRSPVETSSPRNVSAAIASARPEAPAPLEFVEIVTGGAAASDRLPLVIAIHGLGDRPRGFAGLFQGFDAKARVLLPAGPDRYLDGFTWFPFRRDGDEDRLARGIRAAADRISAFAEWAVQNRPTTGRPVVTGFSQGGMISFAMAIEHPERIAAVLPLGGLVPTPLWPKAAPASPPDIIAFHGEADPVVPFDPTRKAVEHLESVGYPVELHPFPGVGHAIPGAMRAAFHEALAREVGKLNR